MQKKKILIIDDEEDFSLLMKIFFTKRNYEVSFSKTLKEGISLLNTIKPDILFLDNNLPDGFGWDKIEYISNLSPGLQINLISAYKSYVSEKLYPLVFHLWEKPINTEELNKIF
jgi:two-component SAPR family response regulator